MKKYISVLAIIFIISLAACSNQTISSTPTGNESNIQSNSITTLDKGIWPVNEYHLRPYHIQRPLPGLYP